MIHAQKCPVCNGTGWVSIPPQVAGDVNYYSGTSCGPWPCRCCQNRILYVDQRNRLYDDFSSSPFDNNDYEFDYTPHKGTLG